MVEAFASHPHVQLKCFIYICLYCIQTFTNINQPNYLKGVIKHVLQKPQLITINYLLP